MQCQQSRLRLRGVAQLATAATVVARFVSGCATTGGGTAQPKMMSTGQGVAGMTGQRIVDAMAKEPGNWMTYHGSYKSWHYSPHDQINTGNVGNLQEAWSHMASRANRGLQN